MASIWIVEQGCYSAYHVVGVFSTKANAHCVADRLNEAPDDYTDRATIRELVLDPAVDQIRQGFQMFLIHVRRDGTVEKSLPWDILSSAVAGKVELWARTKAPAFQGTSIDDVLVVLVWARDVAHAIKIANEQRTRMIANGVWGA